jgi:hypothetical protein
MNPYPLPEPAADDAQIGAALSRELDAWSPPTPRWAAAPARRRIASGEVASPLPLARVRRRLDLVGWLLNQPTGRVSFQADLDDPRVVIYNRLMVGAQRYSGTQAILLRFVMARA